MNKVVTLLVFTAISTVASLFFSVCIGTLTVPVAWASLLSGGLVGGYTFYRCRGVVSGEKKPSRVEMGLMVFFMMICVRQFCWLYYYKGDEILTLNGHGFSDLHLHRAFIGSFLNQTKFWPDSPIIVGESLNYHFGMDLFTALWAKIGITLPRVFAILGIFFSVLTLLTLFWWGRGFAVAGFLFSGGIAGYMIFSERVFRDYAMAMDLPWKNMLLTLLVPQRGYLYAFPAGLILLWSWRTHFIENKPALPKFAEIILLGLMPFFHLHTFLFMSFVYLFWAIWTKKFSEAARFYSAVLLLAVPMIYKLTGGFHRSSAIWFSKGWMMEWNTPFVFFFVNFGFFAPLFLWSTYVAFKEKNRSAILTVVPAWILFGGSMFIMLAPWEWDNIKLICWAYLMLLPVADQLVFRRLPIYPKIAVAIILFLSGFVSVVSASGNQPGGSIMKRSAMDEVCEMLKDVPKEARIATSQEAYHPVLFCGYKIVAGYGGTLYSHGIANANEVQEKLKRLMRGEAQWREDARELNATYLFWGKREAMAFRDSNRPWESEALQIGANRWGSLYDLTKPSAIQGPEATPNTRSGEGLSAKYFTNPEGAGKPEREAVVQAINFKWEAGSTPLPAPFSIIFEGEIYIPDTGSITFYLANDNVGELEIGKQLTLNNSGNHPLRVRKMRKHFKEGWYPIRLYYQDPGGGGYLKLWWQLPSGKEEVIPVRYLRPEESRQT